MEEPKEQKETAIFFRSFLNAIELIPNAEEKALAYKTLIKYALDGTMPETASTIVNIIFLQAKPQIDINNTKYTKCVENGKKGAEFGKKGGRPKKGETKEKSKDKKPQEKPQRKPQSKPQSKPLNVNDNVNVNDYINERDTLSASLSQFENFVNDVESFDTTKYDTQKILNALTDSEFLQQGNMSFILNNYQNVINGKYRTFGSKQKSQDNKSTNSALDFPQRKYTKEFFQDYAQALNENNLSFLGDNQ